MSEIYDSTKDTETHIAKVLDGLKPALDIHYANNRHHPEHFEDGIRGMNLLDLLEMICDWKASSERHNDGDIFKSIEINQKRFGYSDDIKAVLRNTAEFLVKEKKIWKMMDKGLEEKAEEYAQGKGHEHYNFLFVKNAGSPADFAKFCYKDGLNDGFIDGMKAKMKCVEFPKDALYELFDRAKEASSDYYVKFGMFGTPEGRKETHERYSRVYDFLREAEKKNEKVFLAMEVKDEHS